MRDGSAEMHSQLGPPLVLAVRSVEGKDYEREQGAEGHASDRRTEEHPRAQRSSAPLLRPCSLTVMSQYRFSGRPGASASQC